MIFASASPFISAYVQSDWLGKAIFWALFGVSGITWAVLIHKIWIQWNVNRLSNAFMELFSAHKTDPLTLQVAAPRFGRWLEVPDPFFAMYKAMKQQALLLLERRKQLSPADFELVASHTLQAANRQLKVLEKHLFVLPTAAALAPFLGLLGTVWGILLTFSQLQSRGFAASNGAMLTGLSLALATTVLGLIVAIPALVGYNYLKNGLREYRRDLDDFSHELLSCLELHYRVEK
jgi:biopolymer transport protein TolQ